MIWRLKVLLMVIYLLPGTGFGGTLFNEGTYESLISDNHGARVGDIVTVLIFESASATANADSESDKSIGLGINTDSNNDRSRYGVGVDNDYSTGGGINRGGRLVANVSVTIMSVLDNGDLKISGTQELEFNDEKQRIKIEGRIRPEDISVDNTVLSTRVADAKIEYLGDGILGASESPGLFTHIFNFLF